MVYLKSLLILIIIIFAEVGNGICRGRFLTPRLGDFRARQVSVFTGSLNIFVISLLSIKWIGAASNQELWIIGTMWLVLMLAFEILLGRYVFKLPWAAVFKDFNLLEGRLLAIGMLYLLAAPYIAAKILNAS